MPKHKVKSNATLSLQGAYASTDESIEFAKVVLMVDSLKPEARKQYMNGVVVCEPLFESGAVTYKKSSLVSPLEIPIRCDLRHNDDAKALKSTYRLEFKLSIPTTEFEDPKALVGPKTERAHFFAHYFKVFGPSGTSNKVLADNLKAIVKPLKKTKGSALVAAANDKNVFSAISKDCERGMTAGAGTSPQFSPKQLLKFWTHMVEKENGDITSTTYAQITFSVDNLFATVEQSAEDHAAECAYFTAGSELHAFISAHPELAVNKGALRINVAREGKKPPVWTDIANLISVADPANQANKAVTLIGQVHANPWQTWLNKERMRILFKTYLNSIDVYAVEKPYMPEATKKLSINMAAAEAFDRKRKAAHEESSDLDSDDDGSSTEPQSDVDEAPILKKQRADDPETEEMLSSGKASDLAD